MSQPYPQPANFPTNPPPPLPPQPTSKRKRFGFAAIILTAVAALFIGGLLGSAGSSSTGAGPQPTVTVTAKQTIYKTPEPDQAPTTDADSDESGSTSASFTPRKADWKVKLKIGKKQCFGSAGCLVTVKVDPIYVGTADLPEDGTITVFYKITGDESGPVRNSFTVEDGQVSYEGEEDLTTPSSSTKIKATVTSVDYAD